MLEGGESVTEAATAIAATAGGSLRRIQEFEVEFPLGEMTAAGAVELIAEAAFRGEVLRCYGCGNPPPGHLVDCPFNGGGQQALLGSERGVLA